MNVSLNINFDSMRECLKLVGYPAPPDFYDVTFHRVMDRFLKIALDYKAPLSIFVIGQDLHDARNFDAVRQWHRQGHEIGNHSYSHRQDLYQLSYSNVWHEIEKAHHIISDAIGEAPKGFIAPGWSSCDNIVSALRELGYNYDTSLAPSWLLMVAQVVLWHKSRGARRMLPLIRPDWMGSLFGPRQPYWPARTSYIRRAKPAVQPGALMMLPLPTVPGLRLGLWHTLALQWGWKVFQPLLHLALRGSRAFYYLMHPADLIDPDKDLTGLPSEILRVERMAMPLREKERRLRQVLDVLADGGTFVTMNALANQIREKASVTVRS